MNIHDERCMQVGTAMDVGGGVRVEGGKEGGRVGTGDWTRLLSTFLRFCDLKLFPPNDSCQTILLQFHVL